MRLSVVSVIKNSNWLKFGFFVLLFFLDERNIV